MFAGASSPKVKLVAKPKITNAKALMLGLENSGKTTLLYSLIHGPVNRRHTPLPAGAAVTASQPTIGFNAETLHFGHCTMALTDMGGQDIIRKLWFHYLDPPPQILVWVVDACSSDAELSSSATELEKIAATLHATKILFVASHQDASDARTPNETVQALASHSTTVMGLTLDSKRVVCGCSLDDCSEVLEALELLAPRDTTKVVEVVVDEDHEIEQAHYVVTSTTTALLKERSAATTEMHYPPSVRMPRPAGPEADSEDDDDVIGFGLPAEIAAIIIRYLPLEDLLPHPAHSYGAPMGPWFTCRTFLILSLDEVVRRLANKGREPLFQSFVDCFRSLVYLTVPSDVVPLHITLVGCAVFETCIKPLANKGSHQSISIPLQFGAILGMGHLQRTGVLAASKKQANSSYNVAFILCALLQMVEQRTIDVSLSAIYTDFIQHINALGPVMPHELQIGSTQLCWFDPWFDALGFLVNNDQDFLNFMTSSCTTDDDTTNLSACVGKLSEDELENFAKETGISKAELRRQADLQTTAYATDGQPVKKKKKQRVACPGLIDEIRFDSELWCSKAPPSGLIKAVESGNYGALQFTENHSNDESLLRVILNSLRGDNCPDRERYRCSSITITVNSVRTFLCVLYTMPHAMESVERVEIKSSVESRGIQFDAVMAQRTSPQFLTSLENRWPTIDERKGSVFLESTLPTADAHMAEKLQFAEVEEKEEFDYIPVKVQQSEDWDSW